MFPLPFEGSWYGVYMVSIAANDTLFVVTMTVKVQVPDETLHRITLDLESVQMWLEDLPMKLVYWDDALEHEAAVDSAVFFTFTCDPHGATYESAGNQNIEEVMVRTDFGEFIKFDDEAIHLPVVYSYDRKILEYRKSLGIP